MMYWLKGHKCMINIDKIKAIYLSKTPEDFYQVLADGWVIKECYTEAEALNVIKNIYNQLEIQQMQNKIM